MNFRPTQRNDLLRSTQMAHAINTSSWNTDTGPAFSTQEQLRGSVMVTSSNTSAGAGLSPRRGGFMKAKSFHDFDKIDTASPTSNELQFSQLMSPVKQQQPAQQLRFDFGKQSLAQQASGGPMTPLQNLVHPPQQNTLKTNPTLAQYLGGPPHIREPTQNSPSLDESLKTHMMPIPDNMDPNQFNPFQMLGSPQLNSNGPIQISNPVGASQFIQNNPQMQQSMQQSMQQPTQQSTQQNQWSAPNSNPLNVGLHFPNKASQPPLAQFQQFQPQQPQQQLPQQQQNNPNQQSAQFSPLIMQVSPQVPERSDQPFNNDNPSPTSVANALAGFISDPNTFHGKSMRSIQLFNQPSTAAPPQLHPADNPEVGLDSPRMKPGRQSSIPMPLNPRLNIHADSCYNFLNKRKYKIPGAQLTPLEAFFLKESLVQFRTAENLQKARPASLIPQAAPPQIRRTRKYLLVLDIDETLVHSEVLVDGGRPVAHSNKPYDHELTFNNPGGKSDVFGVRIRPFALDFVNKMCQIYDVAIYTASARDYADAVMDIFDPQRTLFAARLYREHCMRQGTVNVKNMELFRDPTCVLVDNLIYSFAFHMNQGIPICPFVDDMMDVELEDLGDVLQNLDHYESFDALIQDLLGLNEFYQSLATSK